MKSLAKWLIASLVVLVVIGGVAYYRVTRNDVGEYQHPGKIERQIAAQIDHCGTSTECRVRLADVAKFDWDKAYRFEAGISQKQIEAEIHAPFPEYQELSPKLIFTKADRVVYSENEAWHVEKAAVNSVSFDDAYAKSWISFDRDAEFIARRMPFEDGFLYVLKPQ